MSISEIATDFLWSIITMLGLAIVCSPFLVLGWNYILPAFLLNPSEYLRPIDISTAIIFNFIVNFLIFFKLVKKDVFIANTFEEQEDLEQDEEN